MFTNAKRRINTNVHVCIKHSHLAMFQFCALPTRISEPEILQENGLRNQ